MSNYPLVDVTKFKIETVFCIDEEQIAKNITYSCSQIQARVEPGEINETDSIAVVCFGPSLLDNWQELRNFKYIITCSGAHKFLIERGIIPTWHTDVDPREHKITLLGKPHPDVTYLVNSTAHHKYVDYLKGYKTLLWHGFQGDDIVNLPVYFPRGEWVFAGGCNAGLRAMLVARFLGFKKLDLYGMDCSYPEGFAGEHAADHPNPAKESTKVTTWVEGAKYYTTTGMIVAARQFFREIALLKDCTINMHGQGMLQHMARSGWTDPEYNPAYTAGVIAFKAPTLYSPEYLELNRQLHQENPNYGVSGSKYIPEVVALSRKYNTTDILDYGCGKGTLAKALPFEIKEYDPAIPEKSETPTPCDLVVCTDVLEHIEPEYIDWVIGDIARCTKVAAFIVIHTGPAKKTLPDGRNTHLIQENKAWWWKKLDQVFDIDEMIESGSHILAWCKYRDTKVITMSDIDKQTLSFNWTEAENVKFVTINEHTKYRVESLRTKEPWTMEWLESLTENHVLVDVGANVGTYSLWAAKNRGTMVYAFEPESQNFALLTQNIYINELENLVKGVNLSLSDRIGLSELNLVEFMPGSSCHQVDSELDFGGTPKTDFVFKQACFSVTLDFLTQNSYIKQPTHIKLDIDGLEPRVITGAFKTLQKVQSLVIEVNTNLPEHLAMIKLLTALGFYYDDNQVNRATRRTGPFTGVAEYVFRRG